MSSNEVVLPVTIRHHHTPSGRLVATTAAISTSRDTVLVGIARCNKKDRPSRRRGRDMAMQRLLAGMGLVASKNEDDGSVVELDKKELEHIKTKNLCVTLTSDEYSQLLSDHPFNTWGCPFGVSDRDQERFERKRQKAKKSTKK